jgi:signal recognition particle GTPase
MVVWAIQNLILSIKKRSVFSNVLDKFEPNLILINVIKLKLYKYVETMTFLNPKRQPQILMIG